MLTDSFEISSLEKIDEKHSSSEAMPMSVEEPSSDKSKAISNLSIHFSNKSICRAEVTPFVEVTT